MAHIRELDATCYAEACGKRAVVEVFNNRNASCGRYCRAHGKRRLAEIASVEDVLATPRLNQVSGGFKP